MPHRDEDEDFEVDLSSAVQVLGEAVVKLERVHGALSSAMDTLGKAMIKLERQLVIMARDLLTHWAITKQLQAKYLEQEAQIKLLTMLVDSNRAAIQTMLPYRGRTPDA